MCHGSVVLLWSYCVGGGCSLSHTCKANVSYPSKDSLLQTERIITILLFYSKARFGRVRGDGKRTTVGILVVKSATPGNTTVVNNAAVCPIHRLLLSSLDRFLLHFERALHFLKTKG